MTHAEFGHGCATCDAALEEFGRDAMARVTALMEKREGTPDGPAVPALATDCEGVEKPVSTVQRRPMELDIGDVIAVHPGTGEPCSLRVIAPPVRFHDDVEIEYADGGANGHVVVHRRDRVTVDLTHRERRHHAMTHGEEHYALAWMREHEPLAFDRAADYVDQVRKLDSGHIRKEARS